MKRRIMLIISIFSVVLILVSTSYALLFKEDKTSKQSYNTGILEISSEALSNSVTLNNSLPMTDSEGENTTPYVFRITNTGNLTYNFNVMLLSTTTENQINSSYIKIKVDDNDVVTLNSLTNGTILENITLKEGEYIDISLRVWLSENTPNSEIGKTFNAKITTEGKAVYTESKALQTLTSLGLSVSEGTPDFSKTSCTSGCDETTVGIYKTQDNLGDTYYFRGDVENNYVYFAGFYWRIIRINGDGTVRMIYDGTSAHANGEVSTDRHIGTTTYNSSYNDNAYVGYMYGTVGSSTYEATHANTNSSTIKTYLDSWYKTNIVDTGYSSYVADAIYCNDREVDSNAGSLNGKPTGYYTTLGYGTNQTQYASAARVGYDISNPTPTLECSQANDRFTINSNLGNGSLTYPIGLITSDEVSMAGSIAGTTVVNSTYYLNSGSFFWTMSPYYYSTSSYVFYSSNPGISLTNVNYQYAAARPVISLKGDAINAGSGSATDPFKIDSTGSSSATLTQLGLTSNGTKESFASIATIDEGVFEAEDDLGTSYYFRGAVTNNYVKFAGYYWRIIRINGDGSIRMIYDGTSAHTNGESSTDRQLSTTIPFNSSNNDNTYVGYMYGTAGATTYATAHSNATISVIIDYVYSWFASEIYSLYGEYIVDAIYCNDRSPYSGNGYGTYQTIYAATNRLSLPTLLCSGANDKFTVNNSLGNGKLSFPVGLITIDESIMAGGIPNENITDLLVDTTINKSYYLYIGNVFWTMSPISYNSSSYANVAVVNVNGSIDVSTVDTLNGVRPVISISPSAIQYGTGSSTNPFRLTSEI